VVICLELGADLHMAQQMPLPLTVSCFSKIQIGFTFLVPFWYRLTRAVLDKGPLNGVCVQKSSVKTGRVVPQTGLQTDTQTDMLITILRSPMRDVKQTATTTDLIEEIPSDAVTVLE